MRKIIVYIAISADGYIARANGSVDWLDRPRIKGEYGSPKFLRSIDTILWGRKTYQQALTLPGGGGSGLERISGTTYFRPSAGRQPMASSG